MESAMATETKDQARVAMKMETKTYNYQDVGLPAVEMGTETLALTKTLHLEIKMETTTSVV